MDNKLLNIINEINNLLQECGLTEEAHKIKTIAIQITNAPQNSTSLLDGIEKAKLFMHPKGIFCDRGLSPLPSSQISVDAAHEKQNELASRFWAVVN